MLLLPTQMHKRLYPALQLRYWMGAILSAWYSLSDSHADLLEGDVNSSEIQSARYLHPWTPCTLDTIHRAISPCFVVPLVFHTRMVCGGRVWKQAEGSWGEEKIDLAPKHCQQIPSRYTTARNWYSTATPFCHFRNPLTNSTPLPQHAESAAPHHTWQRLELLKRNLCFIVGGCLRLQLHNVPEDVGGEVWRLHLYERLDHHVCLFLQRLCNKNSGLTPVRQAPQMSPAQEISHTQSTAHKEVEFQQDFRILWLRQITEC